MANSLGLADEIQPWTPDVYPRGDVAETGGLDATTGITRTGGDADALRAAQPSLDPSLFDVSKMGDAPSRFASGGSDLVLPAIGSALDAGKVAGFSARDRRRQVIDAALPSWSEDPLSRLALVLQAGLAGAAGQKPAYQTLIDRAEKQEENDLRKALLGIQVAEHVGKVAKGLSGDKRTELVKASKEQFKNLGPSFASLLDASVGGGATPEMLNSLVDDPKWYLQVAGGDVQQAFELAKSPEFRKIAADRADAKNARILPAKMAELQELAVKAAGNDPGFQKFMEGLPKGAQGQTLIPMNMLDQLNNMLPADRRFSESELNTLRRNEDVAYTNGILPPKMEMKIAENAITNKPEIVKLQDAYNAALNAGDMPTARLLRADMAKRLRDDPKNPITMTGPNGELQAFTPGSAELNSAIKSGWIPAAEWNAGTKLYIDPRDNTGYMATPLQAQRYGLVQPQRGSTIETVGPDGSKVRVQTDQINIEQFGLLPRVGASQMPGPMRIGQDVQTPAAPAAGAEAAPAPGSTAGGATAPGGATIVEAPPLTQSAAGNAAPLVQPAIPGATPLGKPRKTELPVVKPALPKDTQEKFTAGQNMLGLLDRIERGIGLTGGIQGIVTSLKADPLIGNLIPGDTTPENAMANALAQMKLSGQAMIKGVPSDFDMRTYFDTLPQLWASQNYNKAAIVGAKEVTAQMLVDTLSFNQKDFKIPDEVKENIKRLGVDPAKLKLWSGGDALANTYAATLRNATERDLTSQAIEIGEGRLPVSVWQKEAILKELKRRKGAK